MNQDSLDSNGNGEDVDFEAQISHNKFAPKNNL